MSDELDDIALIRSALSGDALQAFERVLWSLTEAREKLGRKSQWGQSVRGRVCRSCKETDKDRAFNATDLCDNCYRRGERLGWCQTCGAALYRFKKCPCGNQASKK